MMTINQARSIGMQTCVDALGRSFVKQYKDTSVSAFGEDENVLYCFLGVSTNPKEFADSNPDILTLSKNDWPYSSSCDASLFDGSVSNVVVKKVNDYVKT